MIGWVMLSIAILLACCFAFWLWIKIKHDRKAHRDPRVNWNVLDAMDRIFYKTRYGTLNPTKTLWRDSYGY
jgi:hypothetical protein